MKNVHESILDCIGNTPMVRLRKVTEGLKCTVYAKVEFFNHQMPGFVQNKFRFDCLISKL